MEIDSRLALVAPLWFAKIMKAKTFRALLSKTKVTDDESLYTLDLSKPEFCMCGESHGFTGSYYNQVQKYGDMTVSSGCSVCTSYSTHVYHCIKDDKDSNAFRSYITQYLDHIRTQHGIKIPVR